MSRAIAIAAAFVLLTLVLLPALFAYAWPGDLAP